MARPTGDALPAHAATSSASRHRAVARRRGDIADSVSRAVGTCRRGRMARLVNRFQKLAALTLATALGLVTIGVIVRATDSGLGLPRLAALPRPAHPVARRHQGLDRVGPSDRRGDHRLRDPGSRHPRLPRLSRPALDPVAVARRGRAGRLPGVARARDGPPRQQRRVGHGPPGRGADARRAARLPDRSGRLPGPDRRARWRASASRCSRRSRHGADLRPAAVRVARDRHRRPRSSSRTGRSWTGRCSRP